MMNGQPTWPRIDVQLPNGDKIVAEVNPDPSFPEICVFLENSEGQIVQDLCIAGASYGDDFQLIRDSFRVLVYGNENTEDYTHGIKIRRNMDDIKEQENENPKQEPNGFSDVFEGS